MKRKSEKFFDWSEAYDACRERDKPIVATVKDEKTRESETMKIYPSGAGYTLYKEIDPNE